MESETTPPTPVLPVSLAVVAGTTERGGVGKNRRFDVAPWGIDFHGEKMEWDQYSDLTRSLLVIGESYQKCLASVVKYGKQHFGLDKVEQLFIDLQFPHQDAMRALDIGQLELDFKVEAHLTPEHLWVLAKNFLDDPAKQSEWSAKTLKHGLTAQELAQSIEEKRIVKLKAITAAGGRASGGLGYLTGLAPAIDQWERRLGGRKAILELPKPQKQEFLDSIHELLELADEVKKSLEND